VNHVPDATLDAIDEFGEGLLVGTPPPITERLRSDLRLVVRRAGDGTARCRFEMEHTQRPPTLREQGSFVTTVVDGIDSSFRAWGIEPPDAYRYTETVDGSHHYEGRLSLP
jgi:hypothetical protein